MLRGTIHLLCLTAVLAAGVALAQDDEIPLKNWTAPPYWAPQPAAKEAGPAGEMQASAEGMTASAQALPSSPLPFVAITPCRIVDTRVAVADGFHQPNFTDAETRTFTLPSSPDCTGLPATAGAWSLNVQFRPISAASYITLFPAGTTMPTVSTLTASPAAWVEDAAIVPAGTGGAIDVYCQFAGRVVIDINGYYGPQSVVTSLNTQTGDLTLVQGANVTITPGAGTLTIATGGAGGTLPTGAVGQTLYFNGSAWIASPALMNDGTNTGVNGLLSLAATTPSAGQILIGGSPFLHNYGVRNSTFVGALSGNFFNFGADNTGVGAQTLHNDTAGSFNVAVGTQSLTANTLASYNTAVGDLAMLDNTAADNNTAVGFSALATQSFSNGGLEWASYNTAVGYQALQANNPTSTVTGIENTAVGAQALQANTTGSGNTATGFQSLFANTTGGGDTASGFKSLGANTTGTYDTAVGMLSLSFNTIGNSNTAIGYGSLYANTTADGNTAMGYLALTAQSFSNAGVEWPSYNTAVGYQALQANSPTIAGTNGVVNTAVGAQALQANTVGWGNTGTGAQSLDHNTTGDSNTAAGFQSLSFNSTGSSNTAVGLESLFSNSTGSGNTAAGYISLYSNATGSDNTAFGWSAGSINAVGSSNTFLGYSADAGAPTLTNAMALGANAVADASNHVRIGDTAITQIGGQVAWSNLSDARAKTNVRDLDVGLGFVMALRPVSFSLKTGDGRTDMGFLAQDVEALLGDDYSVLGIGGDPDRTLSLRYTDLIAPLVKAVQEQQDQLSAQASTIAAQQAQIEELRRLVQMMVEEHPTP